MSKKLGNLIKEARTAKGLTQAALAEKVSGITSSDVSKIERGEKEPAQDILKKMAGVLGVTQKSLLDAATGAKASSAGKTAGNKKTSASSSKSLVLTANEKKLVELYRKADSSTKKAAMNLLKGEGNVLELFGSLLTGKNDLKRMKKVRKKEKKTEQAASTKNVNKTRKAENVKTPPGKGGVFCFFT